jgi:hypothetical protein
MPPIGFGIPGTDSRWSYWTNIIIIQLTSTLPILPKWNIPYKNYNHYFFLKFYNHYFLLGPHKIYKIFIDLVSGPAIMKIIAFGIYSNVECHGS